MFAVSCLEKLHRADDPGTPPAAGKKDRPYGHRRCRTPRERDRHKPETIGHLGISYERESAKAGQIKRNACKPPWNSITAGKEIADVFHSPPEINDDQCKQQEISRDDHIVGLMKSRSH